MNIFRKHSPEPQRRPHPDARIEAELQRVISLRSAVARKETRLAEDHAQITDMRDIIARHPTWSGNDRREDQIGALLKETRTLEGEIAQLRDEIAARIGKIDDTDLTYLDNQG